MNRSIIRDAIFKVGKSRDRCVSTCELGNGAVRCDLRKGHDGGHRSISWFFHPHVIEWWMPAYNDS